MNSESQKRQILAHLEKRGSITPMEALVSYGCFRLGARIYELREAGYPIITVMEKEGRKSWARYEMTQKKKPR